MKNEQIKKEFEQVKELGERIGYGNMMSMASALWRKSLKDSGVPTYGAFIPVIGELGEDEKRYDKYLENNLVNVKEL